jgi:hypothetical protein
MQFSRCVAAVWLGGQNHGHVVTWITAVIVVCRYCVRLCDDLNLCLPQNFDLGNSPGCGHRLVTSLT